MERVGRPFKGLLDVAEHEISHSLGLYIPGTSIRGLMVSIRWYAGSLKLVGGWVVAA